MGKDNRVERIRSIAVQALALSVQDWNLIGVGEDPASRAPSDLETCVEHITSLFVVRLVALVAPDKAFDDLSTTNICRKTLLEGQDWFPDKITDQVVEQVRVFIQTIMESYNDLPFHNYHHAYHVVLSAHKLLDLMLSLDSDTSLDERRPPAFGLRSDPVRLIALLFAALIHDCDHRGETNRQLVEEEDTLALTFNDASVAENHSLHLGFKHLLKDDFKDLRNVLFEDDVAYRQFRMLVVSAVLSTDLSSGEQTQVSKSKWKEAFVVKHSERPNMRRSSITSEISLHRAPRPVYNRRGSNASMSSVVSDVTTDSHPHRHQMRSRHFQQRRMSNQSVESIYSDYANDSVVLQKDRFEGSTPRERTLPPLFSEDSVAMMHNANARAAAENGSTGDSSHQQHNHNVRRARAQRRNSTQSYHSRHSDSFESVVAESVNLAQKRLDGKSATRQRQRPAKASRRASLSENSDDSSLSLTPPSSDDEGDGVVKHGVTLSKSYDESTPGVPPSSARKTPAKGSFPGGRGAHRRASTGNVAVRFGSLEGQRIDEEMAHNSFVNLNNNVPRDNPQMEYGTASPEQSGKLRKRLGIRRSMDLSGESIEIYSRGSIGGISLVSYNDGADGQETVYEEVDELKEIVVLELILRAADVAHYMQCWGNMSRWSSKLFIELALAHSQGRGFDPRLRWFDNQVVMMESYLLPLARNLDEIGVFGEFLGAIFVQAIEQNLDRWLVDGYDLTETLVEEANAAYPS